MISSQVGLQQHHTSKPQTHKSDRFLMKFQHLLSYSRAWKQAERRYGGISFEMRHGSSSERHSSASPEG